MNREQNLELVRKFLMFGRTDGSYFVVNNENTTAFNDHVDSIKRLITDGHGLDVVNEIKRASEENRAPRHGPLLYALALCAKATDRQTKNAAYRSLVDVCRLPTHLFQFIKFTEILSGRHKGWGRAQRKGISEWYNQPKFVEKPLKLIRLGCKYRRRSKFTHRDVIRLGHVKPANKHVAFAICYFVKGKRCLSGLGNTGDICINLSHQYVLAVEKARLLTANDTEQLCELIRKHQLSHEHIPTVHLNSKRVWESLVVTMPLTALVRHLGKLSKLRILNPGEPAEQDVINRIANPAKLHPFFLLTAWNTYRRGYSGPHRRLVWEPNPRISNALETAFEKTLSNVQPTGKRMLLVVDGSERMLQQHAHGMPDVSARSAAIATVFVICKIESQAGTGNTETTVLRDTAVPLTINTQRDDLESASQKFSNLGTGAIYDPDKAVDWAIQNEKEFDAIVMFTNSEASIVELARRYRDRMNKPRCRFVNVVMSSANSIDTGRSDCDQDMLTIMGLDRKAVTVLLGFIRDG